MVVIDGLLAIRGNFHEVRSESQLFVILRGCDLYGFILSKTPCRVFHDAEGFGQGYIEGFVETFKDFFLQLVNLIEDDLAVFDGRFLNLVFQRLDFLLLLRHGILNLCLQADGAFAQLIIREPLHGLLGNLALLHPRLNFLHVAGELATENTGYNALKIHTIDKCVCRRGKIVKTWEECFLQWHDRRRKSLSLPWGAVPSCRHSVRGCASPYSASARCDLPTPPSESFQPLRPCHRG